MFERYTESRNPRRSSRLAVLLSVSFVGHIAVAAALMIAGMWQIDKLMIPDRGLTIQLGPTLAKAAHPKPMKRMRAAPEQAERNQPVKELVQPDANAPDTEPQPEDDFEYGTLEEITSGDTGDEHYGTGPGNFTIGVPFGDGVSFIEVEHITRLPDAPEKIHNIPSHFLDGKRIAGNERIMPPQSVLVAMYRSNNRRIEGNIKMCIDKNGRVKTLQMTRTMGYKAYDTKLLREMRHWRYRPYRIDNQPVVVCTSITFIFVMTD